MSYHYSITEEILNLTAEISEKTTEITILTNLNKNPILRRTNRIKTVHGSLAIEQNSLTLEQVTAVLNGKIVLAPPKDIEEVKNAFEIYEHLDELSPANENDFLTAHKILMNNLLCEAGSYREKPVGVVNQNNEIIHLGTLPRYVPDAMAKLFDFLATTRLHPLIKSCIFHYEVEQIHPFADGNGRMGRLWHTLILSKWKSIFAYIPIESMIYKNQQEYYNTFNKCNNKNDSTEFIKFMLEIILSAINEATETMPK